MIDTPYEFRVYIILNVFLQPVQNTLLGTARTSSGKRTFQST